MTDHIVTDTDPMHEQGDWAPCPAGEIQQMVRRERTRRTKQKVARLSSATAIVAVLVIGVVVGGRHWLDQQTKPPTVDPTDHLIAGISHSDVVKHLPAYVNDTLARDDPEIYERVFHHLQQCRPCDAKKAALREAQAARVAGVEKPQGIAAFQPYR